VLLAHLGIIARPAAHMAVEAGEVAAHSAPALIHGGSEAFEAAAHAAPEVVKHSSSLVDDGGKAAVKAAAGYQPMSDAERIARSAAGVGKYYAKQELRNYNDGKGQEGR